MLYSKLFTKTKKTAPPDAVSPNAKYLLQGSFVDQLWAGVYSWLPLGLRVLKNVERIVREEMDALGGQEILMPSLHPKENWETTGRFDKMDVLYKVKTQTGQEIALGPTPEEVVTPLVGKFIQSYKDLPIAVYQIQTKFRDELRAKSGVMRGREFGMKDLYSFHASTEDLEKFYPQVIKAYQNIFKRCGLDTVITEASGGSFTKKYSHEFHVLTEAGEDTIFVCPSGHMAKNKEIAGSGVPNCSTCNKPMEQTKGIEAGNIFDLGTRFTEPFNVHFQDKDGKDQKVIMGCFGLGTTRLVGAIVEVHHDEHGIIWPESVAPYQVHLIHLGSKDAKIQKKVMDEAGKLYQELTKAGVSVLYDDRDVTAGAKFADADLLGLPYRVVVSEKTLAKSGVEVKRRSSHDAEIMKPKKLLKLLTNK